MLPWSVAMQQALYGEQGFYVQGHEPASHFRTSVTASPLYGEALARLVTQSDELLGRPATLDVVDLGAADGSLLHGLLESLPDQVRARTNAVGVELRSRPPACPPDVSWTPDLPENITGVVVASEWLDNVPVDVVECRQQVLRTVLVDPVTGDEELGDPVDDLQRRWLERWWPLHESGTRAEIGLARDQAWSTVVGRLDRGIAVAMDYSHHVDQRQAGAFPLGTLTAFREGRQTHPVPDGTCDITAHVALDACAAAAEEVTASVLTTQRSALRALGVHAARPPISRAAEAPASYLRLLAEASAVTELLDPAGLGSFGWLVQTKDIGLPASLATGEQNSTV